MNEFYTPVPTRAELVRGGCLERCGANRCYAQYVWQKSNWQAAEFDALTHSARRISWWCTDLPSTTRDF